MTDRLYYQDAYLKQFEAQVLACQGDGENFAVRLDRSAFYPTSGGQPSDSGTLGGARVLDVWVDDAGEVWHRTDRALSEGERIVGEIDWARRFDHMQQHAGDHLIAGVLWNRLKGYTVGLHLGEEISTIDVMLPDGRTRLEREELDDIERQANGLIQRDLPVKCWFPTEEEMKAVPLRKDPTVKEHIRVVMMGEEECVACGGTHPSSTGQIGLVKILDARPSRGKLRIFFVAGMRALHHFEVCANASDEAAALLSTGVALLPEAVERLKERVHALEYALKKERLEAALQRADGLLEGAEALKGGAKLVRAVLEGLDMAGLREAAARLTREGGVYVLLAGGSGPGAQLIFARSDGNGEDMGKLMVGATARLGGKGGGRPDFAQGAADGAAALQLAMEQLKRSL